VTGVTSDNVILIIIIIIISNSDDDDNNNRRCERYFVLISTHFCHATALQLL